MSAYQGRKKDCGFAIDIYPQDLIEENAEDKFGPRGDAEDRDKAKRAGCVDSKGKITNKGWTKLNADIRKLESNSMAWLRKNLLAARDEGHDRDDDLIGTVWYDPKDEYQTDIIDMGENDRIDMIDGSYGDLSDTVWKGVSDFGASLLGGSITFFDVDVEDEDEDEDED